MTELERTTAYEEFAQKASEALENGDFAAAEGFYKKIVSLLDNPDNLSADDLKRLGAGYLGLGRCLDAGKNSAAACLNYSNALKYSVSASEFPPESLASFALELTKKKDLGETALDVYKCFIETVPYTEGVFKVYSYLESLCLVEEMESAAMYYLVGKSLFERAGGCDPQRQGGCDPQRQGGCDPQRQGGCDPQRQGGYADAFDPSDAAAASLMGKAARCFSSAASRDDSDPDYLSMQALSMSLLNRHDEAVAVCKKLSALPRQNPDMLFVRTGTLLRASMTPEARGLVGALLDARKDEAALLLAADVYLKSGEYYDAEEVCKKALDQDAPSNQALSMFLTILFAQQRYAEMTALCDKFSPGEEFFNSARRSAFHIARAYLNTGRTAEALVWFERIVAKKVFLDELYYYGCALAVNKEYQKAFAVFSKVISGGNSRYKSMSYLQCANIYYVNGKTAEAESTYEKAVAADPENTNALFTLGKFHFNSGNTEKLSALISGHPEGGPARFLGGLLLEREGRLDEALEYYAAAINDDSVYVMCNVRMGIVYCRRGDFQKAFKYLKKADDTGRSDRNALYYFGLAAFRIKEYESAIDAWSQLAALHPDDAAEGRVLDAAPIKSGPPPASLLEKDLSAAYYLSTRRLMEEEEFERAINRWKTYMERISHTERASGADAAEAILAELYFRAALTQLRLARAGDFLKADRYMTAAAALKGSDIHPYYAALFAMKKGDFAGCQTRLSALDNFPDKARTKYHAALALLRSGKADETAKAEGLLREAAALPEHGRYWTLCQWALANQLITGGDIDGAIALLSELFVPHGEKGPTPASAVEDLPLGEISPAAQLAACFVLSGRTSLPQDIAGLIAIRPNDYNVRYFSALAMALDQRIQDALAEINLVLGKNSDHILGSRLAFKLYTHMARQKVSEGKVEEVKDILDTAQKFAHHDAGQLQSMTEFKSDPLLGYLRTAKRAEVAVKWNEAFRKNPTNVKLLHNLALLYYWWTTSPADAAEDLWPRSLCYWVFLENSDDFWAEWAKERALTYKTKIPDKEVQFMRKTIIDEKIRPFLIANQALNKEFVGFIELLDIERQSSACYREVITKLKDMGLSHNSGIRAEEFVRKLQEADAKSPCFGTKTDCAESSSCPTFGACLDKDFQRDMLIYPSLPYGVGILKLFGLTEPFKYAVEVLCRKEQNPELEKLKGFFQ
jgi:tetratricopeptide (TPR) repeat protein